MVSGIRSAGYVGTADRLPEGETTMLLQRALDPTPKTYRNDSTVRTLDSAIISARFESRYIPLSVRVALVTLIPSILLSGIIGATSILTR